MGLLAQLYCVRTHFVIPVAAFYPIRTESMLTYMQNESTNSRLTFDPRTEAGVNPWAVFRLLLSIFCAKFQVTDACRQEYRLKMQLPMGPSGSLLHLNVMSSFQSIFPYFQMLTPCR